MAQEEAIKLFGGKQIRIVWDSEKEKYFFSIVDVIQVLTDSVDYQSARNYWKVLKNRLTKEGNESVTNCNQLKLQAAEGKRYLTDVAARGGKVARVAREELEAQTGKSVVSPLSAKRFFEVQQPSLDLPEETDREDK